MNPPSLEFVFEVQAQLGPLCVLPTTGFGRERAAIYVLEGAVRGPALNGRVLPNSGGDWAVARPDGVLEFDARYLLESDDGHTIYMQNRGLRWASPEVSERLKRGERVDPADYYMRLSPSFEVQPGAHDWLNRHTFVGVGARTATGNVVRYYKVL